MGLFGKRRPSVGDLKQSRTDLTRQREQVERELAALRAEQASALARGDDPSEAESRIAQLDERRAGYDEALSQLGAEFEAATEREQDAVRRAHLERAEAADDARLEHAQRFDALARELEECWGKYEAATTEMDRAMRAAGEVRGPSVLAMRGQLLSSLWAGASRVCRELRLVYPHRVRPLGDAVAGWGQDAA